MKHEFWITGTLLALLLASGAALGADSLDHAVNKAGKNVKKSAREVQDKTCELVDGKAQCFGKKVKHKAQNAVDDIKTN